MTYDPASIAMADPVLMNHENIHVDYWAEHGWRFGAAWVALGGASCDSPLEEVAGTTEGYKKCGWDIGGGGGGGGF